MFSITSRPASTSVAGSRDPFSLMDSLFSDWLSARPVSPLVANARIDVTERNDAYEVRADLPGANKGRHRRRDRGLARLGQRQGRHPSPSARMATS